MLSARADVLVKVSAHLLPRQGSSGSFHSKCHFGYSQQLSIPSACINRACPLASFSIFHLELHWLVADLFVLWFQ